MLKAYDPADHYWLKTNTVYSSKLDAELELTDSRFVKWFGEGGLPTKHPGDAELEEVLLLAGVRKSINEQLEEAFLSLLPRHIGQPYLTPKLKEQIGMAKLIVSDYNRLGLYSMSVELINAIELPAEMTADRQALLALYPAK